VEVAKSPFEVIHNVKLYSIEFQQSRFDYADAMRRLMQQKLHVLMQCAPSRAQAQMLQVVPSFFVQGMMSCATQR
jgi:NADPH-dependent 7-cyano-7-deazaguanine reductase QueF-like protein